jgi:Flp pilus assembly protein TadG
MTGHWGQQPRGQSLVELAISLPLLLTLLCGMWALGSLLRGAIGLQATAREAALAAALASTSTAAVEQGRQRGYATAAAYGLTVEHQALTVEVSLPAGFGRGARVEVAAQARLGLRDVPLLGWAEFTLTSRHNERIDRFRNFDP